MHMHGNFTKNKICQCSKVSNEFVSANIVAKNVVFWRVDCKPRNMVIALTLQLPDWAKMAPLLFYCLTPRVHSAQTPRRRYKNVQKCYTRKMKRSTISSWNFLIKYTTYLYASTPSIFKVHAKDLQRSLHRMHPGLTWDDFTCQWRTSGWERVNWAYLSPLTPLKLEIHRPYHNSHIY